MLAKAGNPKPLETPWYEAEFGCLQMFAFFRVSAALMDERNLKHRHGYCKVMEEVSALRPGRRQTSAGSRTLPRTMEFLKALDC